MNEDQKWALVYGQKRPEMELLITPQDRVIINPFFFARRKAR